MQYRRPKGYLGIDHEIVGMSIVALLTVLKRGDTALQLETGQQLGPVDPQGWYPVAVLLDLLDRLEAKIGYFGLVRTGRTIFQMSHEAHVSSSQHSARDVLEGFDALYRQSNRGRDIGGWRVIRFDAGNAEVEKTTPHHCAMEQGILSAALNAVGCPAMVGQSACVRDGADACRFVISTTVAGPRWDGRSQP